MKPNIFSFRDLRAYLDAFQLHVKKPGLFEAGHFRDGLSAAKTLRLKDGPDFARRHHLETAEVEYLLLLIQCDSAASPELKSRFAGEIEAVLRSRAEKATKAIQRTAISVLPLRLLARHPSPN